MIKLSPRIGLKLGPWVKLMITDFGTFRTAEGKVWRWDGKRWRRIKALPEALRAAETP